MKIPLAGQSYQMFSKPFDAQRQINLFTVIDPTGKENTALYMTPGLSEFADTGVGPCRNNFTSNNNRTFIVSGTGFYEIESNGNATLYGSLNQSNGNVTFAENGTQLAICDGATLYIFTYSTNNFAQVSNPNFPGAGTVTFKDGYFIVNQPGTGKFYISGLYDGNSWDALDFKSAENLPDDLICVYASLDYLWLFGTNTIEVWQNTGGSAASSFPFSRINGGTLNVGLEAIYSVRHTDNSLFWLGRDEYGRAFTYRTNGLSPVRISTEAIELKMQEASSLLNVTAYVYQEQGHLFYILTGGQLETTWVYDITTGLWHERAFLNSEGNFEQHLASCCTFAFNKQLVGDRRNGKVYEMSMDYYSDAGNAILRERTFQHLSDEANRIRYNSLDIGVESGVGQQNGEDANPLISLQLSLDGARTWSNPYTKPIGAIGKYQTKVTYRRLGVTDQMTFRIRISSAVKVAITGAYLS